ncbi:hypothetical protein ACOMHN_058942 [Nucella lapillus]
MDQEYFGACPNSTKVVTLHPTLIISPSSRSEIIALTTDSLLRPALKEQDVKSTKVLQVFSMVLRMARILLSDRLNSVKDNKVTPA